MPKVVVPPAADVGRLISVLRAVRFRLDTEWFVSDGDTTTYKAESISKIIKDIDTVIAHSLGRSR